MNYPPFELFNDPCIHLHTFLFSLFCLCNSWTGLVFCNLPLKILLLNLQLTVGIIEFPATRIYVVVFFFNEEFFLVHLKKSVSTLDFAHPHGTGINV